MARTHATNAGAGPWLAFLVLLVALALCLAAWVFFAAPRPDRPLGVGIAAPLAPPTPKAPDPPILPARADP